MLCFQNCDLPFFLPRRRSRRHRHSSYCVVEAPPELVLGASEQGGKITQLGEGRGKDGTTEGGR